MTLPALQSGSSIMAGKVNPVVPEVVCQVAAQVIGNDAAVAFAGSSGSFELNVMVPVMARNVLQSVRLLSGAASDLSSKCLHGLVANKEAMADVVGRSSMMATGLMKPSATSGRRAATAALVRCSRRSRRLAPPCQVGA